MPPLLSLGWLVVLLAFVASVHRPAAAWSDWGALTGVAIILAPLLCRSSSGESIGVQRRWLLPLAGWALLTAWLAAGLWWSPLASAGRGVVASLLIAGTAVVGLLAGGATPLTIARWVVALGALQGIWGLIQIFGPAWIPHSFAAQEALILSSYPPDDPLRAALLHAVREGRASGSLGAPNFFASFVAAAAVAGLGLALGEGTRRARALAAITVPVSVAGVLLSQSRGGLLALLGGCFVLGIFAVVRRMEPARARRVIAVACVAGALALVGAVAVLLTFGVSGSRWLGSTGLTLRFSYWQAAVSMWQENPILGNGPGSFEAMYPQYRAPSSDETRFAHSWFFEVLAAGGVLGVGFLTLLLGGLAGGVVNALRSGIGDRSGFVAGGVAAALVAVLGHGLLEYTASTREGLLLLAVLASGVMSAGPTVEGRVPLRAVGGVLTLVALVGFHFLVMKPGRAELLREAAWANLEEGGDPLESVALASRSIEIDPAHPAGFELRAVADRQLSGVRFVEDMQRARELNPRSARLAEEMALYHAGRGEWPKALALQKEAVARHPVDVHHRLVLARLEAGSGDLEGARRTWREALGFRSFREAEMRLRAEVAAELGLEGELPPAEKGR